MKKIFFCYIAFIICVFFISCKEKQSKLFQNLSTDETNISFSNKIIENDSLNILKYEYIYNGGGVGLGDFNNDGLTDIYFSGNQVSNRLYLNKGNMKFEDITQEANVTGEKKWCSGVSLIDINNDNLLDIYVSTTTYRSSKSRTNLLYINKGIDKKGIPHFEEKAEEYGIADTTFTTNASFFDYDNDGDLDLYILVDKVEAHPNNYIIKDDRVTSESVHRLYKNEWNDKLKHPVFVNVSKEAGITSKGFGLGVNICDINRDGWKDIYVTNDFLSNDFLYINNHDGTFTNKVDTYLKHTSQSAMGNDVNDINNDGLVDIIAVDMMPENNQRKKMMVGPNNYITYQNNEKFGFQFQNPRNTLQLNQGKINDQVVFSEIGLMAQIAETDWSWCPMVVDFDHDGFRDIIITNGFPKDITDRDFMAYQAYTSRLLPTTTLLEQIPSVKIKNYAFKNNGNLTFSNVTDLWGIDKPTFSNGAAYGDLDNDGDLDYVVNNVNDSASIFKNNLIESKRKDSNYLRIKFKGNDKNLMGLGTFIEISYQNGKRQIYENNIYRGYLSTIENAAHFGLGDATIIDEIKIIWQTGKVQILKNIKSNQVITVDIKNATENYIPEKKIIKSVFTACTDSLNLKFIHKEIDAIDFNVQKLLPHKLSQFGPSLSIGDVNGDNLSDIFIGGPTFYNGTFFIQDKAGNFHKKDLMPSEKDSSKKIHEDMGTLLFDADGDNDMDLYIVSGSAEHTDTSSSYQDRFYINENGIFKLDKNAIPELRQSGSCVKAIDYDKDGDLDLFIGGRVKPYNYPSPVSSRILRNDSKDKKVKFTNVTHALAPSLENIGLVCDALWTDFDNDGWIDLVLAGEWMPITFLKNENGKFKNLSTPISDKIGWWNSLTAGDFDSDGDIDYVAGNIGLNTLNRASKNNPIKIYGKDFDNNGSYDAIPTVFFKNNNGERIEFPFFGRDDMVKQMVSFRKKYTNYKSFSNSSINEVLSTEDLTGALILEANYMQSSYIENLGGGKFKITPLPIEAQFAPVFGMVTGDFNADGNVDVILNGNDYGIEVSQGKMDALNGLLLLGNGKGNFKTQTIAESGIFIPGDGKALVSLTNAKGLNLILASQNRGALKCFKNETPIKTVKLLPMDAYAIIIDINGKKRKEEFYYGSSFLSQSERSLNINQKNIKSVEIVDIKGNRRVVK